MRKLTAILAAMAAFQSFCSQTSLTLENDTFIPHRLGGGDHDYTHGTGLEHQDGPMRYKAGQNMYAPSDLRRSDHIKGDRPYAGMIYGGVGREFRPDGGWGAYGDGNWTHYGEVDFGMIGPAAFCGHTQRFIHKVLGCKDPKGWSHQLHNEFVVNAQWWEKYNWYLCDWAALVPRLGVLAGTVQDAVEAGCDFKVGWNLKNDVGNSIMFSASSDKAKSFLDRLSAYVYFGLDERYYLYNHILEGTMFGHRDDELGVDLHPFVGEIQCGAGVRYGNFVFRYYACFRQDEYKRQKNSPNYGGLMAGWVW